MCAREVPYLNEADEVLVRLEGVEPPEVLPAGNAPARPRLHAGNLVLVRLEVGDALHPRPPRAVRAPPPLDVQRRILVVAEELEAHTVLLPLLHPLPVRLRCLTPSGYGGKMECPTARAATGGGGRLGCGVPE